MRPSCPLCKASSSSTRWLARQQKDPFVKARAGVGGSSGPSNPSPAYRSRSSFKLLTLASKHPFLLSPYSSTTPSALTSSSDSTVSPTFRPKIVVDLGAAPGGWSQVAAHKLGDRGRVFALDILDMEPVPGVRSLKGDFLSSKVQDELRRLVLRETPRGFGLSRAPDLIGEGAGASASPEGIVDVVLSDMMAPMSGVRIRDIAASLSLVEAASAFGFKVLKAAPEDRAWMKKGKERFPGGHML